MQEQSKVNLTDRQGKKLTRDPQEWLRMQGKDEVNEVLIYNVDEARIITVWRNERTKARLLKSIRRPTTAEELEFNKKVFDKGESPVTGKSYNQCEIVKKRLN